MVYDLPIWWVLYCIIHYLTVGGTNCTEIQQQKFKEIKCLKPKWNAFEREGKAIDNDEEDAILMCAILCSMNQNCGGLIYHNDSGNEGIFKSLESNLVLCRIM